MWTFYLLLASIILALAATKRTVRLYFAGQLVASLALFFTRHSEYYVLVHVASVTLITETCVFMVWEEGTGRYLDWKEVGLFGAWMAIVCGIGLEALSYVDLYIWGKALLLSVLGLAMVWRGRRSAELRTIGSMTLLMSVYDFLYLLWPEVRATNWTAQPIICSLFFLWIFARQALSKRIEYRST